MTRNFLFVLLVFSSTLAAQNFEKANNAVEKKWIGTIVLADGKELNCSFVFNPVLRGGMLLVKTDSATNIYVPEKVQSFSFFDYDANAERHFYSLPAKVGEKTLHFFELVYQSNIISILCSATVKNKSGTLNSALYPMFGLIGLGLYHGVVKKGDTSPARGTRLESAAKLHLYDHRTGAIGDLSRNELLRLTDDKKKQVMAFIKQNRLRLEPKNLDEYVYLIGYYSKLQEGSD